MSRAIKFTKGELTILVNLAQRYRRIKSDRRRLQAKGFIDYGELPLATMAAEEQQAWNAFLTSKQIAMRSHLQDQDQEAYESGNSG